MSFRINVSDDQPLTPENHGQVVVVVTDPYGSEEGVYPSKERALMYIKESARKMGEPNNFVLEPTMEGATLVKLYGSDSVEYTMAPTSYRI